MRLLIAFALAFFALPAAAAPITYRMIFENDAGARVGTGALTIDRDQRAALFLDYGGDGICWEYSYLCYNAGHRTPISINGAVDGNVLGVESGIDLYTDATHLWNPRHPYLGAMDEGIWEMLMGLQGNFETWFVIAAMSITDGATSVWAYEIGDQIFSGTVRLAEVPLPAAGWLFLAGLGLLANRRRLIQPRP